MALNYEVDNIDNIDESYRGLYKKALKDGKEIYCLDVVGAVSESDITKLKNALSSEREMKSDFEKKFKAFGEWTPDSIRDMHEKLTALEASSSSASEEITNKMNEIRTNYQNKNAELKASYDSQIADLKKEIEVKDNLIMTTMRKDAVKQVYDGKGDKTMFDAFLHYIAPKIEFSKEKQSWQSIDGLQSLQEVVDDVFNACPGFLATTVSAGARETNVGGSSWDAVFNPKSPKYNKTEQAKLFKQNPERARELLAKYRTV